MMNKQIKRKLILGTLAFALAASTFTACKKEQDQTPVSTSTTIRSSSRIVAANTISFLQDSIGFYHNQALAYAFDQIQTNNLFQTVSTPEEGTVLCKSLISDYFFNLLTGRGFAVSHQDVSGLLDAVTSNSPNYSPALANNIATANQIITNPGSSLSQIQTELDNMLPVWVSGLTNDLDQEAIILYVNVAKSSIDYWSIHKDEWENEFNAQKGGGSQQKVNGKDVMKADGEGAASGAVIGGVTGSVLGGPVGTGAGIVVGAAEGAAIASLTNIVFQLFVW